MKHAWIMGLVLLAWPIGSVGQQRGVVTIEDPDGTAISLYRESHALLVGVSDYTSGWPDLESLPQELNQVKQTLVAQGFHVVTRLDPDAHELRQAFEDFISQYGYESGNRLLFYFSGHGHTWEAAGHGYLVPADAPLPTTSTDNPGPDFLRKALHMSQILAWSRQVTAKHALFLFDSCFSGTVFKTKALPKQPPHISRATALPVRQFITAGSAGEQVPARSVFTPAFVDALVYGWGDTNKDGYITGVELGLYLQAKVPQHAHQSPQFGKHPDYPLSRGDFVFTLADKIAGEAPTATIAAPPPPRRRGNVQVDVNVPATVYLNDERAGEAQPGSPLNQRSVPVGRAAVRVEAPGFQPATQTAQVQRGEWAQLIFELKPLEEKARLTVRSDVYEDRVYIDGQEMGSTRLDVELAPGRHTVRVEKKDHFPYKETVELKAGRDTVIRATLTKKPVLVNRDKPVAYRSRGVESVVDAAISPQKGETWTEPVTGMEFVWIPPGCFQMGSPTTEEGRYRNESQHRVCVESFWLGKHEVTNAQYRRFRRIHDSGEYKERSLNGDDQPSVEMDWHAATGFAAWLSQKTGERFRLPTEAEWEYAARGRTETARYWGDSPDEACAYANVSDKASRTLFNSDQISHDCEDGYAVTAPVGRFRPNAFGLYDMLGNVLEWTCSVYDEAYGRWETVCASKDSREQRVIRGGAWGDGPLNVRSAYRIENTPDFRFINIGFRLARTP